VALAEQIAGSIEERGANGDAAFGETETGFLQRNFQHGLIYFMGHQNAVSGDFN
jgi:hypothetical protein